MSPRASHLLKAAMKNLALVIVLIVIATALTGCFGVPKIPKF
jgi:hypothetical protein